MLVRDTAIVPPTDPELIARIAGGDGAALGSLYDRHRHLVFALACRVLGNGADAEEVLQDVFMQVWRQAARFSSSRGVVEAWLRMMARTRAIDRVRQRSRMATSALDGVPEPAAPTGPASLGDGAAFVLRRAIHCLPWPQRIALELSTYEDLTHTQSAERLGQPLGTIKTRIRLSLAKVRNMMAGGIPAHGTANAWPFSTSPTEYFLSRARPPFRKELSGVKVLVADSDSESAELVRTVLEGAGARVSDARRATDALSRLQECRPDVLLTELKMPGGDGFAWLRRARALAVECHHSLVMAAFSSRVAPGWRDVTGAGLAGQVRKPVQPQALVDAVRHLAQGRSQAFG